MAMLRNIDKEKTKQRLQKVCFLSKTALGLAVNIYGWANPAASPLAAAVATPLMEGAEGFLEHWNVDPVLEEQYYAAVSETLEQLASSSQDKHSWRTLIRELSDMVDTLDPFHTDLDTVIRKAEAFRDQYMNDIDAKAFVDRFDQVFHEKIALHEQLSHYYTRQDIQYVHQDIQEILALLRQISHQLNTDKNPSEKGVGYTLKLPPVSAVGEGFVGRQPELEQIREKLDNHVKPVILSGLGGMGKTELAVHFGSNYPDGNVYFIRFNTSFTATVTAMFRGVCPQPQDPPSEDEQYQTVMELLRGCGEQDLLIIDNVDADSGTLRDLMKDETYKALKAMKLRLILTTRFDEDRAVGIRPMPHKTLYEIFEKHGVSLEESKMDALIEAVNGHTLTIDLMARTLNGKGWRKVTADMLLEDLRSNNLPSAQYRKIATDYNQSEDQAQIYQHLSVVFDAKSVPECHKSILRCATLLPNDGMNGEYFANTMNDEGQAMLDTLIDHGWLNAEDGVITIHPVIRLVCREELKPSDERCGDFLITLWEQLDYIDSNRVKQTQLAEVFIQAAEHLEDQDAEWINCSGYLLLVLAQYDAARVLYENHLGKLEQRLKDTNNLATVYSHLGSIYAPLGDHQKALEFKLKALEICKNILPEDHPDLATSYNNVGCTYGDLGNHQKALEFKLKALEICEKILPRNHPNLAASYNNVGGTYAKLGNLHAALELLLKALDIHKNLLPEDHPDLATSYNNVGVIYADLEDHQKALEFKLKALEIRQKVLLEDHPDLASSYSNLGATYCAIGDILKALKYQQQALSIREKILPQNHPDLALSYYNLGMTYANIGIDSRALEYIQKALTLWNATLPSEHPYIEMGTRSIASLNRGISWMY